MQTSTYVFFLYIDVKKQEAVQQTKASTRGKEKLFPFSSVKLMAG